VSMLLDARARAYAAADERNRKVQTVTHVYERKGGREAGDVICEGANNTV